MCFIYDIAELQNTHTMNDLPQGFKIHKLEFLLFSSQTVGESAFIKDIHYGLSLSIFILL